MGNGKVKVILSVLKWGLELNLWFIWGRATIFDAGEMTWQVKALASKPDSHSWVLHGEEEN